MRWSCVGVRGELWALSAGLVLGEAGQREWWRASSSLAVREGWAWGSVGMEGAAVEDDSIAWQNESEVAEDPSLAMLDWMEYEATTESFMYPCDSCGENVELHRVDIEEGGGSCAKCGGRLLLLDDDEFDRASPLPYDSETINHTTLLVEGSAKLEIRVLPGMRVSWKFAVQDGQALDFMATYAVCAGEFEPRAQITIVQSEPRSELSSNFTMRTGGKLVLHFTNTAGDASEKTEVLCGSVQWPDDVDILVPQPEPEPELGLSATTSGFSVGTDEAKGDSIYGTLDSPGVKGGAATRGGDGRCRVNVAISRLPPFATAEGDISGVIAAPSRRASAGARTEPPHIATTGREEQDGAMLEMSDMASRHSQPDQADLETASPGFTIQEGSVLPPPGLTSGERNARKQPAGGSRGGGLSESLLS